MTTQRTKQPGFLRQAWLVILLASVYGAALAGVHTTLAPRIAENKRRETYDVIPLLIEDAAVSKTEELTFEAADGNAVRVYKAYGQAGGHNGWVLPASGQGFVDQIELLIGLDADLTTITGLYVLDQKETPGLGDRIRSEQFAEEFRGSPVGTPLKVASGQPQTPHEIRAVSGATVSSWAVCEIVNTAISRLRETLPENPESQP